MRFHVFRLVRAATVTLPTLWFIYVLHSVFYVVDSDNDNGLREAGGDFLPRHGFGGEDSDAKDSAVKVPRDQLLWQPRLHADVDSRRDNRNSNNNNNDNGNNGVPNNAEREAKAQFMEAITGNLHRPAMQGGEVGKDVNKDRKDVLQQPGEQGNILQNPALEPWSHLQQNNQKGIDAVDNTTNNNNNKNNNNEAEVENAANNAVPPPNKDDVAIDDDVDTYADVTSPPYVEWLPSGARGQGPKGLDINKEQLSPEEKKIYEDKWNKNSFNQYASDQIPVHRELPDFRAEECKRKQYPSSLPNISVVIIFHNEAWSVLLRSVHSILDRTRSDLLVEIILVDDFSSMDHLKKPLEKYFRDFPKVKIVRAPVRGGLTKARIRGFDITTGEVVVFLDSHIECTEGWAEPMLWMIAENYRTVPFPLIDMITADKLAYSPNHASPYGIFTLNSLTFKWSSKLTKPERTITEPKQSPTMPGGLFAIHRRWFIELGKYDPELDYWGGENMELSFKAWMCGGSVVIAECSHIGHIFRRTNPIKWTTSLGNRNYVRVAMVWMDDYKNHYLERIAYKLSDYGDISDRLATRNRLQCKDFGWYVQNVYPELMEQIVLNATYAGEVRHDQTKMCLDKMDAKQSGPQLFSCHKLGGNQFWYFRDNKYFQMESTFMCLKGKDEIKWCGQGEQDEFSYNETTRQLLHVNSGSCLQNSPAERSILKLRPCSDSSKYQKWSLEKRQPFKYR